MRLSDSNGKDGVDPNAPRDANERKSHQPYETFDVDLYDGKSREDAFVHVMLRTKVEHKRDKIACASGNLAIEFEQRLRGDVLPAGIAVTTAHRYAIEYSPECWLIVPTDFVQELTKMAIEMGKDAWIGDGGNHHNALVPFEWIFSLADSYYRRKKGAISERKTPT